MYQKIIFIVCLIAWAPLLHAEKFSPYFLLESYSYSEPTAIKAVSGDWDERLYPGDLAFSSSRIETGVEWEEWRAGVFRQYDYFYQFNSETAALKYLTENELDLVVGTNYDIFLMANSLVTNGLGLTRIQTISNTTIALTLSYLNARNITLGSMIGNADVTAINDTDLNFNVDYLYSEDKLFSRQVESPSGEGYGVDLNVDWHSANWNLSLEISDLFSRIYWNDVPRTIAVGSNDTEVVDASGFVSFNPSITGIETNQDFTQELLRKIHFTSEYVWGDTLLLIDVRDFEIKRFYSVGAGLNININEKVRLLFDITNDALEFEYSNDWIRFSFITDEAQLQKARTFAFELLIVTHF